jgi:hypothetical protein
VLFLLCEARYIPSFLVDFMCRPKIGRMRVEVERLGRGDGVR